MRKRFLNFSIFTIKSGDKDLVKLRALSKLSYASFDTVGFEPTTSHFEGDVVPPAFAVKREATTKIEKTI